MQLRRSKAMVIMDNRQLQVQTAALFGTKPLFYNLPNVSYAQLLLLYVVWNLFQIIHHCVMLNFHFI